MSQFRSNFSDDDDSFIIVVESYARCRSNTIMFVNLPLFDKELPYSDKHARGNQGPRVDFDTPFDRMTTHPHSNPELFGLLSRAIFAYYHTVTWSKLQTSSRVQQGFASRRELVLPSGEALCRCDPPYATHPPPLPSFWNSFLLGVQELPVVLSREA